MRLENIQIPIPDTELNRACHVSESGFYWGYQSQYRAARTLAEAGLFHEALLALRFSVECFLKHALCAVRYASVGHRVLPETKGKFFRPESLQHDLVGLAEWLNTFFSELVGSSEWRTFRQALPANRNWIEERYSPPREADQSLAQTARDFRALQLAFDRYVERFRVTPP